MGKRGSGDAGRHTQTLPDPPGHHPIPLVLQPPSGRPCRVLWTQILSFTRRVQLQAVVTSGWAGSPALSQAPSWGSVSEPTPPGPACCSPLAP